MQTERRKRLPRPLFSDAEKSYRARKNTLHLCNHTAVGNIKGFVAAGVRMGEALAEASLAMSPDRSSHRGAVASLDAYGFSLCGSVCRHGVPRDADHFEEFLKWQWGWPVSYRGEGSEIEELRGKSGLIVFTSFNSEKKLDPAQVRGNVSIALWNGETCIGPAHWHAARILFWELEVEGSRQGTGLIGSGVMKEEPLPEWAKRGPAPKDDGAAPAPEVAPAPTKKKDPDKYCPDEWTRAPEHLLEKIEDADLRNYDTSLATERGKLAMQESAFGQPGGPGGKGQAFWAKGGKDEAVKQGYVIQEQATDKKGKAVGANKLQEMWDSSEKWKDDAPYGDGSGITQERTWKTISMRSAESSVGTVQAFVAGGHGGQDRVFDSVELPTLLHNDNVNEIVFRNPNYPLMNPKPDPEPIITWSRGSDGCWTGPKVPPDKPLSKDKDGNIKTGDMAPGFALHSETGFVRTSPEMHAAA